MKPKFTKPKFILGALIVLLISFIGYMSYSYPYRVPEQTTTLDLSLTNDDFYIKSENYAKTMEEVVLPALNQIRTDGYFSATDGTSLYYEQYLPSESKAMIVISHGFTENIQKFKEVIYYFVNQGYSVSILDHRSHGLSDRLSSDLSMVHIENFDDFVTDFKTFVTDIVEPAAPEQKLFLYAHSMGGAIGALFLEQYPEYFDAAVLTAPMLKIEFGSTPALAANLISRVMVAIGKGDQYVLSHGPFEGTYNFESSGAMNESRYAYILNKRLNDETFQTEGGSYSWLKTSIAGTKRVTRSKNVALVAAPTLVFQAKTDTYVRPEGQHAFVNGTPNAQLILVPDSKHELYSSKEEIVVPYFNTIFDFFNDQL